MTAREEKYRVRCTVRCNKYNLNTLLGPLSPLSEI